MKKIKCYLPDVNFYIDVEEKYYNLVRKKVSESIIIYKKDTDKAIQITYTVDEKLFEKLIDIIKSSKGKIYDSFKNQKHKEIILNDKYYYLVNSEEYICIKTNDLEYQIVVKQNNDVSANWIVRIMRELYLREKEDLGFSFMHGTGLQVKDKGILLLGTSGSGKTTLAVKFLETEGSKKFLSNDRVLINIDGDMDYFPHAITYAMGTVKNNKHLAEYFQTTNIFEIKKNISYKEAKDTDDCNTPLTDVAKVFNNTDMLARCRLTNIIYPRFNKDMENYEIMEMSNEEKKELLLKTNFTPEDTEALRKTWIRKRYIDDKELLDIKNALIEQIINKVSIKKVRYGIATNVEEILKKI